MKRIIVTFLAIAAVTGLLYSCGTTSKSTQSETPDMHNSKNSLDWAGVYNGILPCADCEGIQTTLELKNDGSYRIQSKYLGKNEKENTFSTSGKFTWDKNGQIITLENGNKYFVGENNLTQLDREGNKVTGSLAGHYILNKMNGQIINTYWKLMTLNDQKVIVDSTDLREPHLMLREKEHRISGNAGCNQFMGFYELKPDQQISFSKIASTLMACPKMERERQFMQMLEKADHYAVEGENLTLLIGDKAVATFKAVYFY